MTRYGPLEARNGVLAVGDLGANHVRLTEAGLVIRRHGDEPVHIGWNTVETALFEVRTTKFRWPGLVTTVVMGAIGLVFFDWGIGEQDYDASFDVTRREGDAVQVDVTRHHVGRYWVKPVRATQALLHRLVTDAESRVLLRHPEHLLATLRS